MREVRVSVRVSFCNSFWGFKKFTVMTRSSRHKSSKHSSRDVRDYSDSEKDSSMKDRKGKDDSSSVRVSKESGSGSEKRKLDSKDSKEVFGSGNGEYAEENNSSSKRRKDRAADDGVNDRWNGGEDERTESSRKSKGSSESKSKRRDDSEEQRSKSEGKHRESSRKESREVERERERERKGREGKNERFVESEEHSRSGVSVKQSSVNEKAGKVTCKWAACMNLRFLSMCIKADTN